MTTSQLLLTGVCFAPVGLILGMLLCLLIWHQLFPEHASTPRKKRLATTWDVRRTLEVLQQLQVLIGREAAEHDPSLADLVDLLGSVQQAFGRYASLEGVIQALVVQDLERQRASRKLQLARTKEAVPVSRQEVMIG